MIRFSEEKVLLLHQLMVAETGGSNELDVYKRQSVYSPAYSHAGLPRMSLL